LFGPRGLRRIPLIHGAERLLALCWLYHRADERPTELLPELEPRWRAEVVHAVLHLDLIGA
jgi:hypothetical protein